VNAALSVSVTVIVPVVDAVPTLLTAMLNTPFAPATKAPETVLVMERSGAAAVTVTVAVDELFAALLSSVVCTVAVLLMLPEAAAFTVTVSTMFAAEAPPAIGPAFVQVTSCPTEEQVQPAPMPETNVKFAFNVSVTVMPPTVGPVLTLLTASWNVALDPATKRLDPVFTMARSGAAVMPTVFVELLFTALLSPEVATEAVSDKLPEAAALTRTVSVILAADAPLAIGPALVQVTSWAALPHTHPVPVAETKLKLLSSVSVTVIAPEVGAVPTLFTAIVKTPFCPAVKPPEWETAIARSGETTVTVSVEDALAEPVVAAMAVFPMLAGAFNATPTVSVIFPAVLAAAIGPAFVQVTTCSAAPQAQFVPVPETKVSPVARVSVTVIGPVVGELPLLLTAMVNTPLVPTVKFPECDFTMESAGARTVNVAAVVEVLPAAFVNTALN
jgi:hypothetical protein